MAAFSPLLDILAEVPDPRRAEGKLYTAQIARYLIALHSPTPLSNRIFASYEDLADHCCDAWNNLVEQPWRIMSPSLRDWAHEY